MKNIENAKKLFFDNFGSVLKIFVLNFVIALVLGLLTEAIPPLAIFITFGLMIYSAVFIFYLYQKMIINNERMSITEMLMDPFDLVSLKLKDLFFAGLTYLLFSVPVVILLVVMIVVALMFCFNYNSGGGVALFIILFAVSMLFIVFYCYNLQFRFYYRVCAIIFDRDSKEFVEKHKKDIKEMSVKLFLFTLIPIVGWLITAIFQGIYCIKIILDLNDNEGIVEAPETISVNENLFEN